MALNKGTYSTHFNFLIFLFPLVQSLSFFSGCFFFFFRQFFDIPTVALSRQSITALCGYPLIFLFLFHTRMRFSILAAAASLFLGSPVLSQLVEGVPVGPLSPIANKLGTICNVLDYGGVADGKTCVGPAILSAFSGCVLKASGGATLLIPPGNYLRITTEPTWGVGRLTWNNSYGGSVPKRRRRLGVPARRIAHIDRGWGL